MTFKALVATPDPPKFNLFDRVTVVNASSDWNKKTGVIIERRLDREVHNVYKVRIDGEVPQYFMESELEWSNSVGSEPTTVTRKDLEDLGEFHPVLRPKHYNSHPSGVECITITQHMNYCLGNAFKYIWRAGMKSDDPTQDLEKAKFYLDQEISRLKGSESPDEKVQGNA